MQYSTAKYSQCVILKILCCTVLHQMNQITISPYTIRMDPSPSPFFFKNYPSTLLKYAMHYRLLKLIVPGVLHQSLLPTLLLPLYY